MILVRDVLRLKFGKAKEAKALAKVGTRIAKKVGYPAHRQLMDLTGRYYTLVLESTHESVAAWESGMADTQAAGE
jgi:hypothetical protein